MEKHRLSTYTSGHWVKASVADPMRNSLTDAIETDKKKMKMVDYRYGERYLRQARLFWIPFLHDN